MEAANYRERVRRSPTCRWCVEGILRQNKARDVCLEDRKATITLTRNCSKLKSAFPIEAI